MPAIHDFKLTLDASEVKGVPGLRCRGLMQKRVLSMLPEIVGDIEQANLVNPAMAYGSVAVKSRNHGMIELEDGTRLHAPLVAHRLARASKLVFGVVTIGNTITVAIDQLFRTGKQLKAVLMEEIANAYLYKLGMCLQQLIDEQASRESLQASGTLAPGDEGFDLSEQEPVLALAGAAAINVTLSESFMMKPRHSISFVTGIGRRMRKWTQLENCADCAASDRCQYRHSVAGLSP
jgi:hypothetical protein